MPRKIQCLLIILAFIGIAGLVAGCTAPRPDPETGITAWISAVNNHDINRIYDLAPVELKDRISRQDFTLAQQNNSFLSPGNTITRYMVMARSGSGENAEITAELFMKSAVAGTGDGQVIPVYIKFVEVFESGEWKVWTTTPQ